MNLSVRHNLFLQYFFVYLIALSVGLYFRLYPILSYTSSDISEKATIMVISQIKAKVSQQVYSQYHNLPAAEKNKLAKKLFDEIFHKDGAHIREVIDRLSLNMEKNAHEKNKKYYLMESDSFYYYALTQNIVDTGRMSDTVKGSKYLNKLMLAPVGHLEPLNLHPYVGFSIYRLLKIFDSFLNSRSG